MMVMEQPDKAKKERIRLEQERLSDQEGRECRQASGSLVWSLDTSSRTSGGDDTRSVRAATVPQAPHKSDNDPRLCCDHDG